jgi:hypothetical protein
VTRFSWFLGEALAAALDDACVDDGEGWTHLLAALSLQLLEQKLALLVVLYVVGRAENVEEVDSILFCLAHDSLPGFPQLFQTQSVSLCKHRDDVCEGLEHLDAEEVLALAPRPVKEVE